MKMALLLIVCMALVAPEAMAREDVRAPAHNTPPQAGKKRAKSLEFDDNVVEGMNKNPLDSLQNIGREDGKSHGRLYKKRTDFQNEIRQSVQEAGYSP